MFLLIEIGLVLSVAKGIKLKNVERKRPLQGRPKQLPGGAAKP